MTTQNIDASAAGHWLLGGEQKINRLGFGAMRLPGRSWNGPAVDRADALAVLQRAIELGVDHIDTADFYFFEDNHANELIHSALHPYPDNLLIATKVGPKRGSDGELPSEAGPGELREQVERNLRMLGLDRLDLVYLRVGGATGPGGGSLADRFAVLAEMRDEGLIRHLGVSNVVQEQLAEAQRISPVAAVQNHYSVASQTDAALLKTCAEQGIAFVPFFPLGGGFKEVQNERINRVADRHGANWAQVALAWLLNSSPAILAIPGTASVAHLTENVAAGSLRLTATDLAELTA
ncbi:oxidoreductase [Actinoalloteichus hymeniacidonis]|nr:oxidoreductase [Actinoalloteichus hymeniacidonis]MBB5906042.1 aryl-alcohol dehydrogenase-like predicted oxidoreductase [Actinoalloteichus hymeniacidonis]